MQPTGVGASPAARTACETGAGGEAEARVEEHAQALENVRKEVGPCWKLVEETLDAGREALEALGRVQEESASMLEMYSDLLSKYLAVAANYRNLEGQRGALEGQRAALDARASALAACLEQKNSELDELYTCSRVLSLLTLI